MGMAEHKMKNGAAVHAFNDADSKRIVIRKQKQMKETRDAKINCNMSMQRHQKKKEWNGVILYALLARDGHLYHIAYSNTFLAKSHLCNVMLQKYYMRNFLYFCVYYFCF